MGRDRARQVIWWIGAFGALMLAAEGGRRDVRGTGADRVQRAHLHAVAAFVARPDPIDDDPPAGQFATPLQGRRTPFLRLPDAPVPRAPVTTANLQAPRRVKLPSSRDDLPAA